jgi:uncharacterized protein DUF4331
VTAPVHTKGSETTLRRRLLAALCAALALGAAGLAGIPASASSHREAPLISQDPTADNTDLYLFRDSNDPSKVDIVANYIGLEQPAGGPNFVKFGDDVLYEIHIDNNADVVEDITYQFRFRTTIVNGNTFLYNTGPIGAPNDANQNIQQTYSVRRIDSTGSHLLFSDQPTPPVNIGPRSTGGDYEAKYVAPSIKTLGDGSKFFAGQRKDAFFVDLGSIFDLAALRPIQSNHLINMPGNAPGVDGLAGKNVHTITIQVPITSLLAPGANPSCATSNSQVNDKSCVIGVYASASRQSVRVLSPQGEPPHNAGRWVQVSRLGLPLVNEVLVPLGKKDFWNSIAPEDDAANGIFAGVVDPELGRLLPVLYPGVFNAGGIDRVPPAPRNDFVAVLSGVPQGLGAGAIPAADLLRLNVSTPVTAPASQKRLGFLDGDAQGFPNGRRLPDDVVDEELQVIAGTLVNGGLDAMIPGTAVPYRAVGDGVDHSDRPYLGSFPYQATPVSGYDQPPTG